MKIASDHYQQGLGKLLGFLVGALVIGTSFPHLLKSAMATLPWRYVIYATSLLSVLAGLAMYLLVPDGPYRKPASKLKLNAIPQSFRNKMFKVAAIGYFGHMWELYAFWVFVPVILSHYKNHYPEANFNVSLLSFIIIVSGSLSCVFSGFVSQYIGLKKTAAIALSLSGLCCIVSPLMLLNHSAIALIAFLLIWSMAVIADSPMFSTMIAQSAPGELRGTALTIVNCIGFFITIISIQLINVLRDDTNAVYIYTLLAIGPIAGLITIAKNKDNAPEL
jgi:predicted MFS family arabinose efflux permease